MLIQSVNNVVQAMPARAAGDSAISGVVANSESRVVSGVGQEVASGGATVAAEQKPTTVQTQNAVDSLNKVMKQADKNLEFSFDAESKQSIVKLVDSSTGDVIRQFPSEEAMAISRSIDRIQQGLLLRQKA